MEMVSKALRNWKIHALALVILVAAEKIGNIAFSIGPAKVVLIPMLYAFVLGALCGVFKLVNKEDMLQTSSLVGVTFFLLMARYGTLVGPSFWKVVHSAPALLLQEFGNLGTILLGVPVAIALGLGRATVGAAFSEDSVVRQYSLDGRRWYDYTEAFFGLKLTTPLVWAAPPSAPRSRSPVSRRWPLSASVTAWTAPKASASWASTSPARCSARCSAAS